MAERIVLFGATGYTGRLTAEAMVERGLRPVLAARNRERLAALAEELGGMETAHAVPWDREPVKGVGLAEIVLAREWKRAEIVERVDREERLAQKKEPPPK